MVDHDGPASYQLRILDNWAFYNRQAIRGPRGLGKSTLAAWCILHFALTHDRLDWKIITTASTWAQLENFLWPEVHKWARLLDWDKVGREPFNDRYELQNTRLRLNTGLALAQSPEKEEAIEGGHADYMFFVYDEAKIIPPPLWDSVEGTFSNIGISPKVDGSLEGGSLGSSRSGSSGSRGRLKPQKLGRILAISTPGEPQGRFFDIHRRKRGYEDWHTIHVTKEETIAAGMMNADWAEQKRLQWGYNSQMYFNHVLGEFRESDEDTLIPLAWIELAFQRWDKRQKDLKEGAPVGDLTSVGSDVGSGGEKHDECVIAYCYDDTNVDRIEAFGRGDIDTATMVLAGKLRAIMDGTGTHVYLDMLGVGTGTYQRLVEMGYKGKVLPFVASGKVPIKFNKDKTKQYRFANMRAAMWWLGREMLDPETGDDIALPRNDDLAGELSCPKYVVQSNATILVESKKDIRKRLKRSTDLADAVLQALVGPKLIARATARVYIPGQGYIN